MKQYITIALGLLATVAASAQNLNPTVQVTNAYEGKLMEVEKQNVPMAVPDSLTQFDWNFNYSVFDNPYKGAYEFNPYLIEMKPDPVPYDGKKFYVRTGAGYSLHPELQAVWSPELKGRFGVTVYDDFKGYWGQYNDFKKAMQETSSAELLSYGLERDGSFKGSDADNSFGVNAKYDAPSFTVSFDGKFDWLNAGAGTPDLNKLYRYGSNNAFGESAALRMKSNSGSAFFYDASARFSNLNNTSEWASFAFLGEVDPFSGFTNMTPNPALYQNKYAEMDLGGDLLLGYHVSKYLSVSLTGTYDHLAFKEKRGTMTADWLQVGPMGSYAGDRGSFSVGVMFSDVLKDFTADDIMPDMADYGEGKLRVSPQFHADYELVEDALVAFVDLTGGKKYNTYASYLEDNHFFSGDCSAAYIGELGDVTVNNYDASIGLSGRISSKFQYKLDAGAGRFSNSPLESISNHSEFILPCYAMADYDLYHVELNSSLRSDRLDASGRFRVQKMTAQKKMDMDISEECPGVFSAPLFTGSADVTYNWNRRIFAGICAGWSTGRRASALVPDELHWFSSAAVETSAGEVALPGWVDLGINAEFKINSKFSLWLKGRNLLNQPVVRNYMVSEKGPYGTIGICVVL